MPGPRADVAELRQLHTERTLERVLFVVLVDVTSTGRLLGVVIWDRGDYRVPWLSGLPLLDGLNRLWAPSRLAQAWSRERGDNPARDGLLLSSERGRERMSCRGHLSAA